MSRFRRQTREVSSRQTARHIEKNVSRSRYERTVGWAVAVRWRGDWCVGWGTAVQTCSESCMSTQTPCRQFCVEPAASVVDASAVWHGTVSVPGGRFWLYCSAHAAISGCCWLARRRVPSCNSPVSSGSDCRLVSMPDRWRIWRMACAWKLHDQVTAITCLSKARRRSSTTPSTLISSATGSRTSAMHTDVMADLQFQDPVHEKHPFKRVNSVRTNTDRQFQLYNTFKQVSTTVPPVGSAPPYVPHSWSFELSGAVTYTNDLL